MQIDMNKARFNLNQVGEMLEMPASRVQTIVDRYEIPHTKSGDGVRARYQIPFSSLELIQAKDKDVRRVGAGRTHRNHYRRTERLERLMGALLAELGLEENLLLEARPEAAESFSRGIPEHA